MPATAARAPVLLVAERQTAGRGRLGRPWQSAQDAGEPRSLTFSLGLPLAPARLVRPVAGGRRQRGRKPRPLRRGRPGAQVAQRPVGRRPQARRHPDRDRPAPAAMQPSAIWSSASASTSARARPRACSTAAGLAAGMAAAARRRREVLREVAAPLVRDVLALRASRASRPSRPRFAARDVAARPRGAAERRHRGPLRRRRLGRRTAGPDGRRHADDHQRRSQRPARVRVVDMTRAPVRRPPARRPTWATSPGRAARWPCSAPSPRASARPSRSVCSSRSARRCCRSARSSPPSLSRRAEAKAVRQQHRCIRTRPCFARTLLFSPTPTRSTPLPSFAAPSGPSCFATRCLADLVRGHRPPRPTRTALIFGDRRLSYGELDALADLAPRA